MDSGTAPARELVNNFALVLQELTCQGIVVQVEVLQLGQVADRRRDGACAATGNAQERSASSQMHFACRTEHTNIRGRADIVQTYVRGNGEI